MKPLEIRSRAIFPRLLFNLNQAREHVNYITTPHDQALMKPTMRVFECYYPRANMTDAAFACLLSSAVSLLN